MGEIGSKSRSLCQSLKNLVSTLVAIVLTQSSSDLRRMFVLIISASSTNMGDVCSKRRSQGQIFETYCYHPSGNSFNPIFLKLAQIVCLDDIWKKMEHGRDGVKK